MSARTSPCSSLSPRPLRWRGCVALAAGVLAAGAVAQQRPITDLSGNSSACQNAKVSPDGQFVAYRTGNRLVTVRSAGSAEITLTSSTGLGSFLWSAAGTTVFAVDGNNVLGFARTGGGGVTLATIPGNSIALWAADPAGAFLIGTRYVAATSRYHVFRLATSGAQPHQDLFDSQDELGDFAIDATGQFLVYLQRPVTPFAAYSLMRAHVDGTNRSDMLGAPLGTVAQGPMWIDAGDRVVVVAVTAMGSLQLLRVDRRTQTADTLTWNFVHQRPTVSPDGRWIVMESIDGVGGNGPALLPVEGGGEVLLHTGERYAYAGSARADGAGQHVVWSASRTRLGEPARVFRADLDGEMRVYPRAVVGTTLTFELPCASSEVGAILLGQRSAPFTLNGIAWQYDLGANFAIIALAAGGGPQAPITVQLPLPNAPVLQGLAIDFQGLRWDPVAQSGEWTRSGRFSIF